MDTREAFDALQKKVKADPGKSIVESFYDEQVFGNFWITYVEGGERLSVVNDRSHLIRYVGEAADERLGEVLVDDLRSALKAKPSAQSAKVRFPPQADATARWKSIRHP